MPLGHEVTVVPLQTQVDEGAREHADADAEEDEAAVLRRKTVYAFEDEREGAETVQRSLALCSRVGSVWRRSSRRADHKQPIDRA